MVIRCGLPEDAVTGRARVTLFGRQTALVEGQHGLIEMSGNRIRLRTAEGVLGVYGEGLLLQELSLDAAMILGQVIDQIAYL